MKSVDVQHHQDRSCFAVPVDGKEAILDYRLMGSQTEGGSPTAVDFTHTYVPPELRGQGLAEALVRQGLEWARENEYDIHASCWYVAKFLR